MNARIKRLWAATLRSGEYRKVRSRLALGENGRCALGVLFEVLIKDGEIPGLFQDGDAYLWRTERMRSGLDGELKALVGITEVQQGKVIHDNDAAGLSFSEIADRIESGSYGI